ncbi:FtsW/RodA/SpoVE family cell cycle protein, partial [Vibrio sp. 1636]
MKMDPSTGKNRALFERFHIDLPLLLGIFALMGFGLVIMYSASGQSLEMMDRQAMRMVLSLVVMVVLAQLSPRTYESLAPLMFVAGVVLLFGVLFFGEASKGAQRWLNLGFVRFQPSELLKLAVPLMVARYIGRQPLPPTFRTLIVALIMVCVPTILIAKQPDLGTSILIAASGIFVIFLAGISWKIIA